MKRKTPLIILVLVAFILSAWGNVIAAAFCPRYLAQNYQFRGTAQQTRRVDHKSCHDRMSGMSMEDMDMDNMQMDEDSAAEVSDSPQNLQTHFPADSSIDQAALNLPNEPCGHCWMHSQPSSGSVVATEASSPQASQVNPPLTQASLPVPSVPSTFVVRMEHGPPGNSSPRHILINVFRI